MKFLTYLIEMSLLTAAIILLISIAIGSTSQKPTQSKAIPKNPITECGNNPPVPAIYRKESFVF